MPRKSLALSLFLAPSTMPLDDDTLEEEEEKFKRARAWMVFQKQPLENAGKQSAKNSWNDSRKPSSGPFGKLLFLFFFSLSSSSFPCTILRPCVLVGSCGKRSSFSSSRRSNGSRTHTHIQRKSQRFNLFPFWRKKKKLFHLIWFLPLTSRLDNNGTHTTAIV